MGVFGVVRDKLGAEVYLQVLRSRVEAVEQRMPLGRSVGQEHADLAVLDASSVPTALPLDCRLTLTHFVPCLR